MKLLLLSTLMLILFCAPTLAQKSRDLSVQYVDSAFGYSFRIPAEFSVYESKQYDEALEVFDSRRLVFRIFRTDMTVGNTFVLDAFGKKYIDSPDTFYEAAREKAYGSLCIAIHIAYVLGRVDSLREVVTVGGLRLVAAYRTGFDDKVVGPFFILDISKTSQGKIAVFNCDDFQTNEPIDRNLALSIALSARSIHQNP